MPVIGYKENKDDDDGYMINEMLILVPDTNFGIHATNYQY
jgi:hypothetical protein